MAQAMAEKEMKRAEAEEVPANLLRENTGTHLHI
jgi:hypothetical protein